jgi:methoxymalonate biosynthesis acyl carrier protein
MKTNSLKIRAFLSAYIHAANWADCDDIFAMGFINSLFAMQLVMWIEKEFGITVENDDLELSNFNSVDNIAAFVDRKTGGSVVFADAAA